MERKMEMVRAGTATLLLQTPRSVDRSASHPEIPGTDTFRVPIPLLLRTMRFEKGIRSFTMSTLCGSGNAELLWFGRMGFLLYCN